MRRMFEDAPQHGPTRRSWATAAGAMALLAVGGACSSEAFDVERLGTAVQELTTDNGLTANGLSLNGLSLNGLSTNGLSTNGLSTNGLSAQAFHDWFHTTGTSAMLMEYLVKCALPAVDTRYYTDDCSVTHQWPGDLGLAPTWSTGQAIPLGEQLSISACLAAHVNRLGWNVSISVLGIQPDGEPIPLEEGEEDAYTEPEGCFFGNLFDDSGVYAASDPGDLQDPSSSSSRQCAITGALDCTPITNTQLSCSDICTRVQGSDTTWHSCTYKGIVFAPITVRLRPQDIFLCGDEVCQDTESCYDIGTDTGCEADCGVCL